MIAKQSLQIVAALALFCAMAAPQARAQPGPSRSSLFEAQRRARMQKRESPKRSSVEQGLTKFDQAMLFAGKIQRGWHGVHLAGGDFPRAEAAEVLRLDSAFTVSGTASSLASFKDTMDHEHFFGALRKAGLPD